MFEDLAKRGKATDKIEVRLSYKIIELFSEGLYSSPNKAIEELVSNSFDAGAEGVHIIISADRKKPDATIVVIDDGTGMNAEGLKQHWVVGVSNKRNQKAVKGRAPIGKFGIGKLATYVLAHRLTHITKKDGKYYSTSMNYKDLALDSSKGIITDERIELDLVELTEQNAKKIIEAIVPKNYSKLGPKLFDSGSSKTWTIAILSDLKDMATELKLGRLKWVLSSAMPLRDDFHLALNGETIEPSKMNAKQIKRWVIGKDIKDKLPKPAPDEDEFEISPDKSLDKKSEKYYGLEHQQLGRITGYAELYEDLLTGGVSADLGRSHGFFIYVNGRLVNIDDEYFGIETNQLRHGTFSRFRAVVHIDRLDEELRSSRESVREGVLTNISRNILKSIFNIASAELAKFVQDSDPGAQAAKRIESSPASLTKTPVFAAVSDAVKGKISPRFIQYPHGLSTKNADKFIAEFETRLQSPEGFVKEVQLKELSSDRGVSLYDAETSILEINTLHPFVAHFLDEYESQSLPLELLAMTEVLTEAHLYQLGIDESKIRQALDHRDETLRYFAKTRVRKSAKLIAQNLLDSVLDKDRLETAIVECFDSLGFAATPLGKAGRPDGIAEANLAASSTGTERKYKVSLEAKSKEKAGTKVSAKTVGVSAIARQRNDYQCDHAIVIGPDFPTDKGDKAAVIKEIKADKHYPQKTITLIQVVDLAKLVEIAPIKRVGLDRLRDLFATCVSPEESHLWVENLNKEKTKDLPYKGILTQIWDNQNQTPNEPVEYSAVTTALRLNHQIKMTKPELILVCKSLSELVPEYVVARENSIELTQNPSLILKAISSVMKIAK